MKKWRLLDIEYLDPYLNMAIEEAILISVNNRKAPNTVRFWRNANAVVVGCFQSAILEINLEAYLKYDTVLVRRFTGGGTVYHDHGNLNWTVVVGKDQDSFKDINKVFEVLSRPIIQGLRDSGISARLRMPNSIQVNDKKISGMAAYMKRGAVLCHGTLLVNTNLDVLKEILLTVPDDDAMTIKKAWRKLRSVPTEVTTLQHELNKYVPISVVKKFIIKSFRNTYGIVLEREKVKPQERSLARDLYETKYALIKWNFRY